MLNREIPYSLSLNYSAAVSIVQSELDTTNDAVLMGHLDTAEMCFTFVYCVDLALNLYANWSWPVFSSNDEIEPASAADTHARTHANTHTQVLALFRQRLGLVRSHHRHHVCGRHSLYLGGRWRHWPQRRTPPEDLPVRS